MFDSEIRKPKVKFLPIIIFIIFGIFYYFSHQDTVPITGRSHMIGLSTTDEMQLGIASYQQILQNENIIPNGKNVDLIKSVGTKIASATENTDFEWEFNLIDSDQNNAFCLPGGKVAVYSGILNLTQNADGLAVVLGHEVAHAIARHGAERMAQEQLAQFGQMAVGMAMNEYDQNTQRSVLGAFGLGTQVGLLLPFSRMHESEADHMGLIYMAKACFNPEVAPIFWEKMQAANKNSSISLLSTHPSDETRIENLKRLIPVALETRNKFCQ